MVVPMKRLELLLYHKERDQFLDSLRSLGVVHIVQSEESADTNQNQQLQNLIRRCEKVITGLRKIAAVEGDSHTGDSQKVPEEIIEEYEAFEAENEKLSQELLTLGKDYAQLDPWGSFDPSVITKLGDSGVTVRFYVMAKKKFEELDTSKLTVVKVNEKESNVYFIVIDYGAISAVPADEVRLPENSLDQLINRIAELKGRQVIIARTQAAMLSALPVLESFRNEKESELRYEYARASMAAHAEGKVLHLSGWFPNENSHAIEKFTSEYAAYYTVRDPLPDENVPVKLKNKKFSRLFEPVTGIYSLPHYLELDITPFMAPFFTLFFGLCLGDVGYGALLLVGCLFASRKVPVKMRPLLTLVTILSISTMISGLLLNNLFGQPLFGGPGVDGAFLSSGVQIFSPLSPITTEKGTVYPMMSLALLLGFIQLLFGMGIKAYISMRNYGFTYGLQPISTILLVIGTVIWGAHADLLSLGIPTFSVGPVLIGKMLLAVPMVVAKILIFAGFALFFLFNNMGMKIFMRPLIGIYEFYNFASGILGQVLSYIRLFALGLAGGLLGAAFNQIAFMFITKADGTVNYASIGIVGTIVVLILGHGMNLSLALIGSFVHPLRLTFVEFYGAIGFRGGSKPFQPFTKIK